MGSFSANSRTGVLGLSHIPDNCSAYDTNFLGDGPACAAIEPVGRIAPETEVQSALPTLQTSEEKARMTASRPEAVVHADSKILQAGGLSPFAAPSAKDHFGKYVSVCDSHPALPLQSEMNFCATTASWACINVQATSMWSAMILRDASASPFLRASTNRFW